MAKCQKYELTSGKRWVGIGTHLLRSKLFWGGHDIRKAEKVMAAGELFDIDATTRVRQNPHWKKLKQKRVVAAAKRTKGQLATFKILYGSRQRGKSKNEK